MKDNEFDLDLLLYKDFKYFPKDPVLDEKTRTFNVPIKFGGGPLLTFNILNKRRSFA